MTPAGKFQSVSYADIRYIAFVKDFDGDLAAERREFVARPKQEGLWVRMRFRDGQTQEGLAANNLLAIDAYGFTVAPPESSGNVQRLFVPRAAIEELKVLGVVGSPARRPAKQPKAAKPDTQIDLFS